jgi:hypothetical protein
VERKIKGRKKWRRMNKKFTYVCHHAQLRIWILMRVSSLLTSGLLSTVSKSNPPKLNNTHLLEAEPLLIFICLEVHLVFLLWIFMIAMSQVLVQHHLAPYMVSGFPGGWWAPEGWGPVCLISHPPWLTHTVPWLPLRNCYMGFTFRTCVST